MRIELADADGYSTEYVQYHGDTVMALQTVLVTNYDTVQQYGVSGTEGSSRLPNVVCCPTLRAVLVLRTP